jgi:hypothetical protein
MTMTEKHRKKLAKLRAAIKRQEDVVFKASCDIPTWGGRSFYVDWQHEVARLELLKKHYERERSR